MKTRAVILSIAGSAGVLLLGWEIGNSSGSTATSSSLPTVEPSSPSSPSPSAPTGTGTPTNVASPTPTPTISSSGLKDGNFDGNTVDTQFGPVQVQAVVSGGRIVDVKALQLTNYGGRSVEISNSAAPILRSEALKAQSAQIASVSGATYTSDGYIRSLQYALNKAKT